MKKIFFLILLLLIPSFAFAGNNTSLEWLPQDTIISTNKACSTGSSTWWNGKNYEQLEFTWSSKYNSVYGFKKKGSILYFTQVWWSEWASGSIAYMPNNANLFSYNCVSRRLQKIASWSQFVRHINIIQSINGNYVVIQNGEPEASFIDYTIVNKKTWKVIVLSTIKDFNSWKWFDAVMYNIEKLDIRYDKAIVRIHQEPFSWDYGYIDLKTGIFYLFSDIEKTYLRSSLEQKEPKNMYANYKAYSWIWKDKILVTHEYVFLDGTSIVWKSDILDLNLKTISTQ